MWIGFAESSTRARMRATTSRASLSVTWPNTMTLRPLNRRASSSLPPESAGFFSPVSGIVGSSGSSSSSSSSSGSRNIGGYWLTVLSSSASLKSVGLALIELQRDEAQIALAIDQQQHGFAASLLGLVDLGGDLRRVLHFLLRHLDDDVAGAH